MDDSHDMMTFDDLGVIYRMESKSNAPTSVRKDLYPAMAQLLIRLKRDCDKELERDSESYAYESLNSKRNKARGLVRNITERRMRKIAELALQNASGGGASTDMVTLEEREYYNEILRVSKEHMASMSDLSRRRKPEIAPLSPLEDVPQPEVKMRTPDFNPRDAPLATSNGTMVSDSVPNDDLKDGDDSLDDDFVSEMLMADEEMMMDGDKGPVEPEPPKDVQPIEIGKGAVPVDSPIEPAVQEDEGCHEDEEGMSVIRVLETMPRFSGPKCEYDLRKEDIVRMPGFMAMALVASKKAVYINPSR